MSEPTKRPKKALYRVLAGLVLARKNCMSKKKGHLNDDERAKWKLHHELKVVDLVRNKMPSGSGIDCGTTINWDLSTEEKLVFHTSFHHMNDAGIYDGWTDHDVYVKPSLFCGITLLITGTDRNQIKDYLHDIFRDCLEQEVEDT